MSVRNKKMFSKTFLLAALIVLLQFFQLSAKNASERDKATEKFKKNVVRLDVHFYNETSESGFGFVVGEKDGLLLVVTANHVVRKDEVDAQAKRIDARFYTDMGDPIKAELLDVNFDGADLALLKIRKPSPGYQWEKNYISPPGKGDIVWFIGRNQEWWVPTDRYAGEIADTPILATFTVRISSVLPGTSGAPLISPAGIVGMIISDDLTEAANALDIEIIKLIVQSEWNYPWGLNLKEASETKPNSIGVSKKKLDIMRNIVEKK